MFFHYKTVKSASLLNIDMFSHKKVVYLVNVNEEKLKKIKKNLSCVSIYPLFHMYKYMVWCFFETNKERREFESLLPKEHKKIIYNKTAATKGTIFDKETKLHEWKKEYKKYKLSKEDFKILKIMGEGGARDTLLELEKKTGLSIDVIRYRKKKLEKNGYFLRHIIQPGNAFSSFKFIYVIFDTKMERSPGKEPLYSVRGMEFYTTGQFLQTSLTMARAFIAEDPLQDTNTTRQLEDLVYGNSDLINLICADMDSYFVANPNPKC